MVEKSSEYGPFASYRMFRYFERRSERVRRVRIRLAWLIRWYTLLSYPASAG